MLGSMVRSDVPGHHAVVSRQKLASAVLVENVGQSYNIQSPRGGEPLTVVTRY